MTRKEAIEEAAFQYQLQKKPVAITQMNINKDFVAGAEWADKHSKHEEPQDKDFKDFIKSYMTANDDNILHFYDRYDGLVDGAQWQKERMMKDVVEGTYDCYDDTSWISFDGRVESTLKVGDKVKVIIIKED